MESSQISSEKKSLTESDEFRYNRQIKLSELGLEGQVKLKNAKVIVIGAGGLGSSCLMHLAGSGIGKICIIDNDVVDVQNLHRQIIHNMKTVGMNKAISAKKFINELNPDVEVIAIDDSFTNKNAFELCKDYDIIIDCCDNPKTRYICNDIAVLLNKPFISAASVRWDGQVGIYVKDCEGNKLPCYRCLNPKAPIKNNVKKCAEVGVIGTLPSIIGTLEANEAIKFILGKNEQILKRKIMIFDGYDNKVKIMKTRNFMDICQVCGPNRIIYETNFSEYDYDNFINGYNNPQKEIPITGFTQEDFEKFLVDESFPFLKKIKELYSTDQYIDKEGKDLTLEEVFERRRQKATDMIEQINNGHLLSSEPDWKQATVMLSLSGLLYCPGYDASKVHKARDLAFSRLVRSHKCLPATEAVEQQTIVTIYLRYINNSIEKEEDEVFYFYKDADSFKRLWEVFCNELESSVLKLKKKSKTKYLKQIKVAEEEIDFFRKNKSNELEKLKKYY